MGDARDNEAHSDSSSNSYNRNMSLGFFGIFDRGATYIREKIVLPSRTKNPEKFYHRRFKRVPTVDQCDFEDYVCIYEADQQFFRDKMVDSAIVKILRQRRTECHTWEGPDANYKCAEIDQVYEDAATNWFMKYGEMKSSKSSIEAYMKQKHRLIWERRHPDTKMH